MEKVSRNFLNEAIKIHVSGAPEGLFLCNPDHPDSMCFVEFLPVQAQISDLMTALVASESANAVLHARLAKAISQRDMLHNYAPDWQLPLVKLNEDLDAISKERE